VKATLLAIALVIVALTVPLRAQTVGRPVLAGPATLAASNAACLVTNCISINLGGYSAVSAQLFGACGTCTAQFEETVDGTNWVAINLLPPNGTVGVSSTAAAGIWQGAIIARSFRVRLSAWASGSWVVSLRAVQSL
jgi:hypothetical protein